MILIADAGSTKIEWALVETGVCRLRLCTHGFNAAQADAENLSRLLREEAPEVITAACGCRHVHYYGAGCIGSHCDSVSAVLNGIFTSAEISVESDMLAAARALCGDRPGIVCILGTGSNSCLYDGQRIVDNVPPMGFILGDEGSGAALGKTLLTKIFKRELSDRVVALFDDRYPEATKMEVIERVYRGERPAAYLASFAPFLKENIGLPEISGLVTDELQRFFSMNILHYSGARKLPVNFIGSIASHFKTQLHRAAESCGCTVGKILQAPMDALIDYHVVIGGHTDR